MFYTIKAPWLIKKLYPSLIWEKPTEEKVLYLTFDDGPHAVATPFVLEQLKRYNAKATFFCIGNNVIEQKEIYTRILEEGHKVGNHSHNHLNGFKTDSRTYINNIFEAAKYIDSNLFRPPYGRITKFQIRLLTGVKQESKGITTTNYKLKTEPFKIIMWTVLSGDFDTKISGEHCLQNVLLNVKPGNIIVFHDSSKAWDRMNYALPRVLDYFNKQGYVFKSLE